MIVIETARNIGRLYFVITIVANKKQKTFLWSFNLRKSDYEMQSVNRFHNESWLSFSKHPDDDSVQTLIIFARMNILMVCLGNICRSPLAEGILQHKAWKAGLQWSIESAGTNGYHIGQAPHHLSQKVASLNGIDICKQRARRFKADDFDKYDKIYAMATDVVEDMKRIAKSKFNSEKVDLLLNELYPGEDMDVPDPWYGPEPGFHEVYKMIDAACDSIISKYAKLPAGGQE